jgi:hypothetical protein
LRKAADCPLVEPGGSVIFLLDASLSRMPDGQVRLRGKRPSNPWVLLNDVKPGRYKIRVSYQNDDEQFKMEDKTVLSDVWTGDVPTPFVEVNVLKPEAGREEAEETPSKATASPSGGNQRLEFKLGQKLDGEIEARTNVGGEGHLTGYRAVVPLTLKAGQNVSASVTVVGKLRTVGLMLKDPTGKILGSSKMESRTARISVEEVNANGKYMIEVFSDLIGPYTLWAADTTDELDKKMLQEKINQLEKDLATLREKLKAKETNKP